MEKLIESKADELLMWLKREERMTLPELEKALGIKRDLLEQWINIFESHGLIELIYPPNPVEPPYVVIKHGQ